MGQLRIRPLHKLSDDQFDVVQDIFEQAYPDWLRLSIDELDGGKGSDRIAVAGMLGEVPVGFAAVRVLPRSGWSFLRYFAITPDRRREGLGRRMWTELVEYLAVNVAPRRLLWEAQLPERAAPGSPQHDARSTALAFYESIGGEVLPVHDYVMPTTLGLPAEPMLLMALDPAGPVKDPNGLVKALLSEHYGVERYQV
ncbi:GNAT family N-acetyltransferase [Allokutzneria albata]|uniref:Acetyltransferase (GNAT) family protein n=1 Tax=Allokutzneria albata TaxID=211114 RepID=A0A1H0BDY2_ALLAB|nr:GNAT family N-acetyltransferase [Allokutzneria albata]SDN43848.1 Acetyltransferase (GNAT) family protein [Allokutzneria albata]